MNLLSVALVLFANVYCTRDQTHVETAYLVKHNFRELKKNLPVDDKNKLCCLEIKAEGKNQFTICFDWDKDFFEKENTIFHRRMFGEEFEKIIKIFKSSENDRAYLRFKYFYTNKANVHKRLKGLDKGDTERNKTFKIIKSDKKTFVEMYNDEPSNVLMHHVAERFSGFLANDLLIFNKKILREWDGKFDKKPNFNLHYFKNYSDCLKDLKTFLEELDYAILIDDLSCSTTISYPENTYQKNNILKLSRLINFLERKFNKDYGNRNMEAHEKQNLKSRFFEAYKKVKHDLLNYNMILPLNEFFTIEYHLEQLYASIIKKISETSQNCVCSSRYQITIPCELFGNYRHSDKEPKKITLQDLIGHKNTLNYFFNYFNKQSFSLENYFDLEKVVCDFNNMVKYLSEMLNALCFDLNIHFLTKNKAYSKPILLDNYKCKFMRGISIRFFNHPGKGKIKAFENKRKEVTIEENVDYFYDHDPESTIFIPFENMLNKKIQSIEVYSEEKDFLRKITIKDFLAYEKRDGVNVPLRSFN